MRFPCEKLFRSLFGLQQHRAGVVVGITDIEQHSAVVSVDMAARERHHMKTVVENLPKAKC